MAPRSRYLLPLLALLVGFTGCPALDVSEPIALVPDDDWTAHEHTILANAAECWNLEFGTRLSVGASSSIMQQVKVGYSDFICLYAAGRTETTLPVSVHVCPTSYFYAWREYREAFLFSVLLHELGHVLNIRPHADDPGAVMAADDRGRFGFVPELFAEEDRRLFSNWNEGVSLPAGCRVTISELHSPPSCQCL